MQLRTGNNFTVVRQIANHLDTDTNYVRAVIRNAYSDAIIETLDLDNKGSQRFSKSWRIPQDPSGNGFYVSIVTSVYTDAGYTTKNQNYGDEENTYLVADAQSSIGKGSTGIDARTVRRIIAEELDKREETEDEEEDPRVDAILQSLASLQKAISETKPVVVPPVDLKHITKSIQAIEKAVKSIDVKPVVDTSDIEETLLDMQKQNKEHIEYMSDIVIKNYTESTAVMPKFIEAFLQKPVEPKPVKAYDISKLTL